MKQEKVVDLKRDTVTKAVEQYLTQKKQRNENTFKNYLKDIEHFFETVFNKHYKFVTVSEFNTDKTGLDGLMDYFDSLFDMEDGNGKRLFSNGTINRKQASIKSLLKFLKIKKVYVHDLSELDSIKNLPKDTKNIEYISFEKAMEYAEWFRKKEANKGEEKYIITRLAIDIGKRVTELLKLKWNQFTVESKYVLVSGVGKRNKKWNEKISLKFYEEILQLKGDSENVFTLSYGSDIVRMINRAKKAFGDTDRAISFHSFRKCSLTNTYRLTGDIFEVQRKGNHESLDTTKLYIETEDYGITGFISLGDNDTKDLYKTADRDTLLQAIELMNKDFRFILNYKLNELKNKELEEINS